MVSARVEKSLAEVELCFSEVSAALVTGEPLALEVCSAAMRQAAIDISNVVQGLSPGERQDPDLKLRLLKISEGMATVKDGLFRRAALVDMALKTVVPTAQDSTYAKTSGPYGSPARQTGAFKYLAA